KPVWRRFDTQLIMCAFRLAFDRAGNNMAARIAMMAMTTSSSIKVKAFRPAKTGDRGGSFRGERLKTFGFVMFLFSCEQSQFRFFFAQLRGAAHAADRTPSLWSGQAARPRR